MSPLQSQNFSSLLHDMPISLTVKRIQVSSHDIWVFLRWQGYSRPEPVASFKTSSIGLHKGKKQSGRGTENYSLNFNKEPKFRTSGKSQASPKDRGLNHPNGDSVMSPFQSSPLSLLLNIKWTWERPHDLRICLGRHHNQGAWELKITVFISTGSPNRTARCTSSHRPECWQPECWQWSVLAISAGEWTRRPHSAPLYSRLKAFHRRRS